MLYRSPRARLRIPHQLAAVAALALLIIAWTGRAEWPAATPHANEQSRAEPASVETARLPDGDGSDRPVDARTGAPISLMLFRFN